MTRSAHARPTAAVVAALLAWGAVACGDDGGAGPSAVERVPIAGIPTPADDRGRSCADVVDARACFGGEGEGCVDGACVVARTVPPMDTTGAWRCHGVGAERRCVPRTRGAGAFDCAGASCTQAQPRLPDASFWECIDDDGIVVCKGGEPASGVFPAEPDPGWRCAPRRGDPDGRGDRICVDASPDLPEDAARGFRCHFEHHTGEKRICVRDGDAPAAAAPCESPEDCGRAMVCAAGRCIPHRIDPACWLDRDCDTGQWCRFGTCTEGTR